MWKERYRIGVDRIDDQHKELFHRVTEFLKALRSDGTWEEKLTSVKQTMAFMQDYVVTHFNDEEDYQQQVSYPGYNEHRAVHERFKQEVMEFAQRMEAENYPEELVQQFAGKLLAWLINHVAASDQKIGEYVKSLGGDQG